MSGLVSNHTPNPGFNFRQFVKCSDGLELSIIDWFNKKDFKLLIRVFFIVAFCGKMEIKLDQRNKNIASFLLLDEKGKAEKDQIQKLREHLKLKEAARRHLNKSNVRAGEPGIVDESICQSNKPKYSWGGYYGFDRSV